MGRRLLLIIFPLLVVAGLLFWLRPDPMAEPVAEGPLASDLSGTEGFLSYDPGGTGRIDPDEPEASVVPLPAFDKDAIPGEYTVAFDSEEAMQAFIGEAEANGMTVLETIPELGYLRLQGSARQLGDLLKEGMEAGLNYEVSLPAMPDPEFWENANMTPFTAGVLAFLGIDDDPDRATWGRGITVAILDTGIGQHPDLGSGRIREINLIADDPGDGAYVGHGTAVAGLVASTGRFAEGVVPGSELLSVRVLDSNGGGNAFTLARGIVEAVNAGADVINMSLGGYGESSVLREAVEYATGRGVVLVASTGNDGLGRVTYPAALPSVIGVTAVDGNGNRAPFSNYGNGVDIASPGFLVNALWEGDEYILFNGTSAAAPLVAGMAARVMESGLAASPEEVRDILMDYANETGPPGDDSQYGAGLLNAERIEVVGESGLYDIALADLYPALEEGDGASFPLYIILENRGTEFLPEAMVEISVNDAPYFYRFSGLNEGAVESIQLPVSEQALAAGQPFTVRAKVMLPEAYEDQRPSNDAGSLVLQKAPTPEPED